MIIIEVCLPVAIVVISSASEIGQLKSRLDKSAYIEDDFFDQIISSYVTTLKKLWHRFECRTEEERQTPTRKLKKKNYLDLHLSI